MRWVPATTGEAQPEFPAPGCGWPRPGCHRHVESDPVGRSSLVSIYLFFSTSPVEKKHAKTKKTPDFSNLAKGATYDGRSPNEQHLKSMCYEK